MITNHSICRLCLEERELRESHIIPKLVTDWQKDSSGTGFLRSSEMPNKRAQDGIKEYMLCEDCEELFNKWETPLATTIFHPLNRQEAIRFKYQSWLLKFAVSVSWRVLTWYKDNDEISELQEAGKRLLNDALQTWKEFLLGARSHPGSFEQHMILIDFPKEIKHIKDLPPNWNRFLIRGCHINLAHSKGHPQYIYIKMGRITLLGFLGIDYPRQWVGTKIHVNEGMVGGDITVPVQFLNYLKERARIELNQHDRLSKEQKDKIDKTYRRNIDRAVISETVQALDHDVRLFGRDTVFNKNDEP